MIQEKKRKEVNLDTQTLALLQMQADKEGRKLKNYMEYILRERANAFQLTDAYKTMMDEMLEKHKKGTLNYSSWEALKKQLLRK